MKLELALVVTLCVGLAACGGQPPRESEGETPQETTAPTTASADEEVVMSSDFEDASLDEWDGAVADGPGEADGVAAGGDVESPPDPGTEPAEGGTGDDASS